jgi:hypothetical protein
MFRLIIAGTSMQKPIHLTNIYLWHIYSNTINITQEVWFMATQKVAITVPPLFLKRVDQWAKKRGKSRSRFIVEELDNRLKTLEDEEITRLYNEVCADRDASDYDNDLAEEMLGISAVQEEEKKW